MNRILFACIAASGLYGFAAAANAATVQDMSQPIIVSAGTAEPDSVRSMLAELHDEVQTLQTEVQSLAGRDGEDPSDPHYAFSVAPPPNPDDAPIPSGG